MFSSKILACSRPETALFGHLGVRLRIFLCGVQEYASAQILAFLDLAQKSLVSASRTAQPPSGVSGWELASIMAIAAAILPTTAAAQLSADWMIPAAAHNRGVRGTFWMTDLSLHNPHEYDLPVVVQALPSDVVNSDVPTISFTLYPWETVNLWDVLGPEVFDLDGTAALLAYADPALACDPIETCHLLVTSRTYTPENDGGDGEFGLTVPGVGVERAADWSTLAYAAGILADGQHFRCNVGVGSWTPEWTTVRLDVQDSGGAIVTSDYFDVPPFGHTQHRLPATVTGGTLVFYLESGPADSLIFPYATVINQVTGDASFFFAEASTVGATVAKESRQTAGRPSPPPVGVHIAMNARATRSPVRGEPHP